MRQSMSFIKCFFKKNFFTIQCPSPVHRVILCLTCMNGKITVAEEVCVALQRGRRRVWVCEDRDFLFPMVFPALTRVLGV